jgi:phenylalanyl-tRNA synthetase beta chain
MKVSESWLREWINSPLSCVQLAEQLTLAGLEVDHVLPVASPFSGVIVAYVVATSPHPQADRLTLCEVDVGQSENLRIVCGAANVRPGLKVALAMIGAQLSPDFRIKESKLRGELSQGMLCSASELGFQESSNGIIELPEDAPVGMNIREYLQLDDQVFDIDLTPNRADCFSIQGVAREVGALNRTRLVAPEITPIVATTDVKKNATVQAPTDCPLYALRVIKGVDSTAITPIWMKERLRRSGLTVIHPIVDVVNYVMLELGQPMHAFDLSVIQGDIHVRHAKNGESLVLLNEQTVALDEHVLVIADEHQVLAMAGIMGGDSSAVQVQTVDILLESAFFHPLTIAGVGRRYGLSTESSQRFERGVDPLLATQALERVTTLLLSIVGGDAGPITKIHHDDLCPMIKSIAFNPQRVAHMTGVVISEDEMLSILDSLGFSVEQTARIWHVEIPTHRFDVTLDVDLIEEILRLYGYDKIEPSAVQVDMRGGRVNRIQHAMTQCASFLSMRGYHETISYSFVDPIVQREFYPEVDVMSLLNPISAELSQMRVGLWPGLMASLMHNMNRQQTSIRCFETGVIFERIDQQIKERTVIGGILSGEKGVLNWSELSQTYDFYDMKGDIQALLANLKCTSKARFIQDEHSALHPGQTARIFYNDEPIGWVGALHPKLADAFDISSDVFLFELMLAPLSEEIIARYQRISKYPQIRRDLSLLMDKSIPVAEIERVVRSVVPSAQLKAFDVFDHYIGSTLPENKKSVAVALTLQDDERTLVDDEINIIISAILKELELQLTIVLRV